MHMSLSLVSKLNSGTKRQDLSLQQLCENISLMLIKIQQSKWISRYFRNSIEKKTATYTTVETHYMLTS